jgi:hypothetical protein
MIKKLVRLEMAWLNGFFTNIRCNFATFWGAETSLTP